MGSRVFGMKGGVLAAATVMALVGSWACVATGGGTGEGSSRTTGRDADITREELESTTVDDAMEAVSLLRPHWLRARPARTINDPSPVVGVVIDGLAHSTRDDLAQLPIGQVERISFLNAGDATIRYGTGFTGGAIIVTTRK